MARILVDTNVYLELFKTNDVALAKHAETLANALREEIFVSTQIVDEVARNKVRVAGQFFADQLAKIDVPRISLPIFTDATNEAMRKMQRDISHLKKDGQQQLHAHLSEVSAGRDQTSLTLNPLFIRAVSPSLLDIERARERRERGNPPGKQSDPLGDQIIWEQFLAQLDDGPVWIISKDSDYATDTGDALIINALLQHELHTKTHSTEIHIFKSLAAGIKSFQTWQTATDQASRERISDQESAAAQRIEELLDEPPTSNDSWSFCTVCEPDEEHGPGVVEWTPKFTAANRSDPDSLIERGVCNWCRSTNIYCRTCGATTGIHGGQIGIVECDGGCGMTLQIERHFEPNGESWKSIHVSKLPNQ